MSLKAREVLADASVALEDFEASATTPYWRTRWVALITILRAVGHILDKVDGESDGCLRVAIDTEFAKLKSTRPEPKIYWQFIDAERNTVLKEMLLGAHLNITVRPGAAWWNATTDESGGDPGGPTTYDHFMRGGSYDGRDPRELSREAIQFWQCYLDEVERRAADSLGQDAV